MSLEVNVCTLHPKLNGNGFWYCIISSDWNRDIGIFKNVFLGKPLRSRITDYKRLAISHFVPSSLSNTAFAFSFLVIF